MKKVFGEGSFPRKRSCTHAASVSLLLVSSLIWVSCLRERGNDDCPPTYSVTLGVKDKNYANVGSVPGMAAKDEQLPFKSYVSNLAYYLRNMETGTIVQNVPAYTVTNNDKTQALDFTGVPDGRYILSVFGNISSAAVDNGGILSYNLHPANAEDMDTYLLTDTIDFTSQNPSPYLELQRTKGNLYILIQNLPDSVARIEEQVSGVSQNVDQSGGYNGEGIVLKSFTDNLLPSANMLTFLAPTVTGKNSIIRLALYTKDATTPFMFIPDFNMTVKRNEVAAFMLNFKPEGGIEIWVSADGTWTKLHDMDITTI